MDVFHFHFSLNLKKTLSEFIPFSFHSEPVHNECFSLSLFPPLWKSASQDLFPFPCIKSCYITDACRFHFSLHFEKAPLRIYSLCLL